MSEETIRVHLKMLRGDIAQPPTIEVKPSTPVEEFREKVAQTLGLGDQDFRIIFCGKTFKPGTTIAEYNVKDDTTVQVLPMTKRAPPPDSPPAEDPAPPPPPPPPRQHQPIRENPDVLTMVCNTSNEIAKLQSKLCELQEILLSGDEGAAAAKMREFLQVLTEGNRAIYNTSSSLNRVLPPVDAHELTNFVNHVQGMVQQFVEPLLGTGD